MGCWGIIALFLCSIIRNAFSYRCNVESTSLWPRFRRKSPSLPSSRRLWRLFLPPKTWFEIISLAANRSSRARASSDFFWRLSLQISMFRSTTLSKTLAFASIGGNFCCCCSDALRSFDAVSKVNARGREIMLRSRPISITKPLRSSMYTHNVTARFAVPLSLSIECQELCQVLGSLVQSCLKASSERESRTLVGSRCKGPSGKLYSLRIRLRAALSSSWRCVFCSPKDVFGFVDWSSAVPEAHGLPKTIGSGA
mmetsp:Transcript_8254/g.20319  ORF Transcript_8254/g.20319 Transcript_8254/m.20319 type:complete len:254 (-) Transcript_8254:127-888(-)